MRVAWARVELVGIERGVKDWQDLVGNQTECIGRRLTLRIQVQTNRCMVLPLSEPRAVEEEQCG